MSPRQLIEAKQVAPFRTGTHFFLRSNEIVFWILRPILLLPQINGNQKWAQFMLSPLERRGQARETKRISIRRKHKAIGFTFGVCKLVTGNTRASSRPNKTMESEVVINALKLALNYILSLIAAEFYRVLRASYAKVDEIKVHCSRLSATIGPKWKVRLRSD